MHDRSPRSARPSKLGAVPVTERRQALATGPDAAGVEFFAVAGHGSDQSLVRYIEKFSPNMVIAVLVGLAGFTFLLKAGGGLYWLIPAAVASLLGGVVNSWLFLIRVTAI